MMWEGALKYENNCAASGNVLPTFYCLCEFFRQLQSCALFTLKEQILLAEVTRLLI